MSDTPNKETLKAIENGPQAGDKEFDNVDDLMDDLLSEDEDMVNHPPHYCSHKSGVECIQITRHMNFNLGNAVKYIWRADEKGKAIEDLEKAQFYIKDEIAKRKKEKS